MALQLLMIVHKMTRGDHLHGIVIQSHIMAEMSVASCQHSMLRTTLISSLFMSTISFCGSCIVSCRCSQPVFFSFIKPVHNSVVGFQHQRSSSVVSGLTANPKLSAISMASWLLLLWWFLKRETVHACLSFAFYVMLSLYLVTCISWLVICGGLVSRHMLVLSSSLMCRCSVTNGEFNIIR